MNIHTSSRAALAALALVAAPLAYGASEDASLVLHYRFDAPAETVRDLSDHGNDGKVTDGEFLPEVEGRRNVLRLNGKSSYVDCGSAESLHLSGDATLEMWVRQNGPTKDSWGLLFGESPVRSFHFSITYDYGLGLFYRGTEFNHTEAMVIPAPRKLLGPEWTHLAMVVEYPRCRFYRNGELVRDAFMPIPGLTKLSRLSKRIGGGEKSYAPIDLTEVRVYRRAVSGEEIALRAAGKEANPAEARELAVEPDWYAGELTVRLVQKNRKPAGEEAEFVFTEGGREVARATGAFKNVSGNESQRFEAVARIPLKGLGAKVKVAARVGAQESASREVALQKPEWIHSKAGRTAAILPPWTPVRVERTDGALTLHVWGRRYELGAALLPAQIEAAGRPLLERPASLAARVAGKEAAWEAGPVSVVEEEGGGSVRLEQELRSGPMRLKARAKVDFDGFITYDLELAADTPANLDRLALEIPFLPEESRLCYAERVFPKEAGKAIAEWFSGAVEGPLAFQFSPNLWIGGNDRGLTWQAESNAAWSNADPQRAITITPGKAGTLLQANWVDTARELKPGEKLHYRFALLATPVKPLERDAWALRVARYEPWGLEPEIPTRKTSNGTPEAKAIADLGVRHLFTNINDLWPWPLPISEAFSRATHGYIDALHAQGVKMHNYTIHQRMPTTTPEFDLYGLAMSNRPLKGQYVPTVSGKPERPGSLALGLGADSQSCSFMCPKSEALQDAFMHALERRLKTYKDDGVYLDGTVHIVPCSNEIHGCGYRKADGTLEPTYPVFGVREMMQRIYALVRENAPGGIVDVHCSFGYNPASLAYADIMWTGEQWHHLRKVGTDYVAGELTLDKFRTEFTGRQLGIAAETLHYRLRNPMKIAATSLLHDISPRYSLQGFDNVTGKADPYFALLPELWKMRDRFGAQDAEKLFYWENAEYATVAGDQGYVTLLKHPRNGVLALVSNLSQGQQELTVKFDLAKLGLAEGKVRAWYPLTGKEATFAAGGEAKVPLESEEWAYLWLQPEGGE